MLQKHLAAFILHRNGLAARHLALHGKHRIGLPALLEDIQHIAGGDHRAAVNVDAHVGVDARIHAAAAGLGNDLAAVHHQPAVGIDAIALAGLPADPDMHLAAVDGGNRHTVLVGVDAVIAGGNMDVAAVDG